MFRGPDLGAVAKKLAERVEHFPNKQEWLAAQARALEALQTKLADREAPDILRVDYPGDAVTAEQGPVFDRPDAKRRPVILDHAFFSPDPKSIRRSRTQTWNGTRPVQDEIGMQAQVVGTRAVSFVELATDPFRQLLRDTSNQRLFILTGVVLRYQGKDWYPVVDFKTDGRGEARVEYVSKESGRFIRFCEESQLQSMVQRYPKGHALLLV